jgi:hypothetical protein
LAGLANRNTDGPTRFLKAGSVDYKKVVELKGVDLEKYRGNAREEVRVTAMR